MLYLIDNYDSFTYNLVQYFQMLQMPVTVAQNDKVTLQDIQDAKPTHIVISPGPGNPSQAGISLDVVKTFSGKLPLLGVCLGHQCIGQYFGGNIKQAQHIMHGKTSQLIHEQSGLFKNLKQPLQVTRYHSLVVDEDSLPDCLKITAKDERGEIMALQHKTWPVHGVQFHPESILSEQGLQMLQNFLHE